MKSPKKMVAILAVSTLGLTGAAVAETLEVENGIGGRQAAEESRQGRSGRNQTADTDRRSQRQQRRLASEDTDVDADIGAERRARRSRSETVGGDTEADTPNYRRNERRQTADRRENRAGYDGRADRYKSNRHARTRDGRNNGDFNRREFGHKRGDQRKSARSERRYGNHDRGKHRGFDNRVDRRQSKQHARTRAGWKNGDLSRRELKRLRKDQHKIARMDRRFGSDGRYTRPERRKMNKALDRSSHRIHKAKHNRQVPRHSRPQKRRW